MAPVSADPTSTTPATAPERPLRWWQSGWISAAVVLLLVFVVRSSLVNHYVVPSSSMEPTLMPGDRVWVNMTTFGVSPPFSRRDLWAGKSPDRGEVVVFPSPKDGTRLIKRVVAVAGDTVELRQGRLSINGASMAAPVSLKEEQLGSRRFFLELGHGGGPDLDALTIPAGKVLLLGDARGNSQDGRVFGLVDVENLYGRASGVFYRRGDGFTWRPL